MPESCTCGTRLVEGARFCHRCGKPVYETELEDLQEPPRAAAPEAASIAVPEPATQTPTAAPASYSLPIGFNNPIALRVAMLLSPVVMLFSPFPLLNILAWFAGGWFSVILYRRLTGARLSANGGARLGSLIGLMTFLGVTAITAISLAFSGKSMFEEAVAQYPQVAPMLNDTGVRVVIALLSLLVSFAIIVGACAAGGALGAKLAPKSKTVS